MKISNQHIVTHPATQPYISDVGKTIYSRNGGKKGIVSRVHMRHCAACGYAPCYLVSWEDGRVTKPCVAGVVSNPDGSLRIQ